MFIAFKTFGVLLNRFRSGSIFVEFVGSNQKCTFLTNTG